MEEIKIIIVEDESIVALDIQQRLEAMGYSVVATAASGEDAIEQCEATPPDLVLMDIRLNGEIDGIETAGHIRSHADIPVIYLTAYADDDTLQRAKISEPFGYLIKPIEDKELKTAIEISLQRHRFEQALKESEQWLSTILNSIGEGVIATDTEGRVRYINAVAETLMDCLLKDSRGDHLEKVIETLNENAQEIILQDIKKILSGIAIFLPLRTSVLTDEDGSERSIEHRVTAIHDDKGDIMGAVVILKDVTERKQAHGDIAQYATHP